MCSKYLALLAGVVLTLTGCSARQLVRPGELYEGELINIRAPTSWGWLLMQMDHNGVTFIRGNSSTDTSYVAQIMAFHEPPMNTSDELLASFKTVTEQNQLAHSRYKKPLELHFEITSERPYPCVRLRGTVEDLKAVMLDGTVGSASLYIRSFYCQHPTKRDFQFLIMYSQRGGPPDPNLDSQAQSFINGIQVP